MIFVLLARADSVQSKKKNEKNASRALQVATLVNAGTPSTFFSDYFFDPNLDGLFRGSL